MKSVKKRTEKRPKTEQVLGGTTRAGGWSVKDSMHEARGAEVPRFVAKESGGPKRVEAKDDVGDDGWQQA